MFVERYSPYGWCNLKGELHKDKDGNWVKYEDYCELLQLYTQLLIQTKERDNLVALIGDISEVRLDGE